MQLAGIICGIMMSTNLWNAEIACNHMETVVQAAEENNIPAELLNSLIVTESAWSPSAISHAGACGLTQVMPKYTGGRATDGVKYTCLELTSNPELSIHLGAKIYRWWLTNYANCKTKACSKKQHRVALCGYNAGFRCKGENPNKQGMRYASVVLNRAHSLSRRIQRAKREQK